MLETLVLQIKVQEILVLDNNQFLIYNKVYHKAGFAQWGTGGWEVGTYKQGLYPDQLWTQEPHPSKEDCYYIVTKLIPFTESLTGNRSSLSTLDHSCYYTNYRIAKYGVGDEDMSMYGGPKYPDQLWRLVPRFKANFFTDQVFHFNNGQGSKCNPVTR